MLSQDEDDVSGEANLKRRSDSSHYIAGSASAGRLGRDGDVGGRPGRYERGLDQFYAKLFTTKQSINAI
eukprot:scaffold12600_cov172-Skeletonema_dohrnii-CCMP3373.AAC.4